MTKLLQLREKDIKNIAEKTTMFNFSCPQCYVKLCNVREAIFTNFQYLLFYYYYYFFFFLGGGGVVGFAFSSMLITSTMR